MLRYAAVLVKAFAGEFVCTYICICIYIYAFVCIYVYVYM